MRRLTTSVLVAGLCASLLACSSNGESADAGSVTEDALRDAGARVEELSAQVEDLEAALAEQERRLAALEAGGSEPSSAPAELALSEDPLPAWFREYGTGFVVPSDSHLAADDASAGTMLFIIPSLDSDDAWIDLQRKAGGVGGCGDPEEGPPDPDALEGPSLLFECVAPPVGGIGEGGTVYVELAPVTGTTGSLNAIAEEEGVHGLFVGVAIELR